MKIWLRRVLALALIAMGIALVAFKFNNIQSGSIDTEIVKLQLVEFVDSEIIESQFPGIEIIDVTGPELNEDDYPCIWRVFNYLDEDWLTDSCEIDEWELLEESVLIEKQDSNLIIFRGVLSSCIKNRENGVVIFNYLGENNLDLQDLTDKDLSRFPIIQKSVIELEAGKAGEDISEIPLKEWEKLVDRHLELMYDLQCFRYNGKVYGPEFSSVYTAIEGEIANLGTILKIVGGLLLLLGLILIRKLYFRKRGIMVNPQKVAFIYDVVTLLLAVPSAWLVASLILEKLLFIPPVYEDDEMYFMGVFFFCFGIPFVALFTSRLTSQSVKIDSKGVLIDSIRNKEFISWQSIESIDFSDEHILVGRLGVPMPRKLQKSLKITVKSGDSI
ncbi:MAG: hypothetical protein HOA90_11760, partial [Prolixibacteraceae bacterium]|nr:hypothetical protein [Prolixibacteraceae bacterium]